VNVNDDVRRKQLTGFKVNGTTALYGIIGKPVAHSLSPAMQTCALQHAGLNAVYLAFPSEVAQLPDLLDAFALIGVKGFNVTAPFKEAIVTRLDELSPEAAWLGSVNTVKRTDRGWCGYSSDGIGLVRSLAASGIELTGRKVLLIGAGGSARSIALALIEQGCTELHITNRTVDKSTSIIARLRQSFPSLSLIVGHRSGERFDIMINATTVGLQSDDCPVSDIEIAACRYIVDIIYHPFETPLLRKARKYGIPAENGLGMLLYQGVVSFEIWTEREAPVMVMREALLTAIGGGTP
jgi:shikimate dehydrogenase